jgi:CRISPR type III-A-associated RAMP protein Csm4
LLNGAAPEEDRWFLDGASECLMQQGRPAPFRIGIRSSAAVDRLGSGVAPHVTACLEFHHGCGLWATIWFASEAAKERWKTPVEAAFRLLADSGFGGDRSRGWGRSEAPEFIEGALPDLILAPIAPPDAAMTTEGEGFWAAPASVQAYWLLSLFVPNLEDAIDWERGFYDLVARGGRVESPARSGDPKRLLNMVSEGSVLLASGNLRGLATDVAPDGFPHPVYRAGFALAIPIPQAPQ